MKSIYDMDIDELEKRKKLIRKLTWLYLIIGAIYTLGSMYFYLRTGIIGLSLMIFISGMLLDVIACLPSPIGLLIYLKKRGM
jgi:hypothetical protein